MEVCRVIHESENSPSTGRTRNIIIRPLYNFLLSFIINEVRETLIMMEQLYFHVELD